MPYTSDIGERIELVSMDPHFHNISIGLYRQREGGTPALLVHTYSQLPRAEERIRCVIDAMVVLGGMQRKGEGDSLLVFPCGSEHTLAARRLFLEACKLSPDGISGARPRKVHDKKAGGEVEVVALGGGAHQVRCDAEGEKAAKRVESIVGGLVKLAEMEWVEGEKNQVAFSCGLPHDELIGLLLPRALNVRAVLREQQLAAAKGQLLAPSAQER